MVRISDARMSGTAFGTIVLHVSPGGGRRRPAGAGAERRPHPRLDVASGRIDLLVDEAELRPPQAAGRRRHASPERGYTKLYWDEVLQAEHGCDFDFLRKHPLAR